MIQLNETDLVNHAAPYRGPVDAVRICLRKYVDFDGRASRSELWGFALFILLCEICMLAMRVMWEDWRSYMPGLMPEFILFAVFVTPATAVGARRLHDTGRGDWRLLFFFLPAAMLISTMASVLVYEGGMPDDELHTVLHGMSLGTTSMLFPVAGYGIGVTFTFIYFVYPIIFSLKFVPIWLLAAIYIPLATFAYWWAKNDNATQNGFYFDGLPVYKKLFIVLVLAMPVLATPVAHELGILGLVSKAVYFLFLHYLR